MKKRTESNKLKNNGFSKHLNRKKIFGKFNLNLQAWLNLLRWNKPTGRLILLFPAAWSLWLVPVSPPPPTMFFLIFIGGIAVSGAGCIINDLWDRRIDPLVERTRHRPLASNQISVYSAIVLLLLCLLIAFGVVMTLPNEVRPLCLSASLVALASILLYPSAKRWFALPQIILAFCWGFAVLIPWIISTGNLVYSPSLFFCWLGTIVWTFGFDTVYAMADRRDDILLGIRSSALSLGKHVPFVVVICYGIAGLCIAISAQSRQINGGFWLIWGLAFGIMIKESLSLHNQGSPRSFYGQHFKRQAILGGLIFIALLIGRAT
uniref:4-hydroxybenzoate polyprenyltransferase, mitochondrial n=1 Tax=Paulinella chromatophora TaxID=39717 RepID=B1X5E9_PAUCH|nr:probable 4-hydroxybenzoate- octaprenyltransferase [Paulinella chromatophora]ACB43168.1 probable 4-hydroxybenzoate- octaprenyltransferase [Paulinella chromatophora]